ncbi:hypothetical protein K461DRAFT_298448 [Myriangium duriaei CBS 260.36]|uniref:Uncharacterized protein n=1 Tax=Myriangium duriaei CBS 260.36 TaxID=1168546 RepID=A0A9P4MCH0_9PEZI|nr:hypothetical protein K461DRAFT_298448 [Myriangium duriaei CBS 260.36]
MPGKSKSAPSKERNSAHKPAGQARPNLSLKATSQSSSSNTEEQNDEDDEDGDRTPLASKAAVTAPSTAQDTLQTPTTPTKHSRELLAGLDLSTSSPRMEDTPYRMEDAITKKVSELTASGWRPEEELNGFSFDEEDDDDAYAGVDLLSVSDEDDDAIRKQESRSHRHPEMSLSEQDDLARRLSLSDAGSDMMEWNGFDDADFTTGSRSPSTVTDISRFLTYDETRPASFLLADNDNIFPREPKFSSDNLRKVRFQDEVDGSDGDSSDDDDLSETFPDIFTDTPQFTPSFQRTNNDEMFLDDGSDAGSVWDFEGEEHRVEDEEEDEEDEWSESDGSSSGYDSDEGETTDEEEPCPPKRRASDNVDSSASPVKSEDATPKAAPTKATATTSTSKKVQTKSKTAKNNGDAGILRLPKAGIFDMDPRRNVLLVDGAGATQRNTLYPAKIQTADERKYWQKMHQAYQNRTSTPHTSVQISPDFSDDFEASSSFFSPTSPFDSFGSLMPNQVVGPAEAFLPFTSVDASGIVTEDASMMSGSEDGDGDVDILSPFVNFDDHKQDDDDDSADTSDFFDPLTRSRSNTLPSFASSAPPTPSPATPELNRRDTVGDVYGGDLFSHLSRSKGLVHSFRMNQHYAKHLASYAADPTVRYSTSELNAMQSGRRKAANTPITPMRKKRGGSLSKIGKVDWSKGLGVEKMGPPSTTGRDGLGHFKRPSSSGSSIGNGKKGPARGLFR